MKWKIIEYVLQHICFSPTTQKSIGTIHGFEDLILNRMKGCAIISLTIAKKKDRSKQTRRKINEIF